MLEIASKTASIRRVDMGRLKPQLRCMAFDRELEHFNKNYSHF